MTKSLVIATLSALLSSGTAAESARPRTYTLPGGGSLDVPVPSGWREAVTPSEGRGLTITLTPSAGTDFEVLITVVRGESSEPMPRARDDLRALVERRGRKLLPTAVEKTLKVEELRGPQARGYYYSLTDQAPRPGEYGHVTQGAAAVGSLSLSFTILTRSPDAPARGAALGLLRRTRQGPTAK